MQSVLSIDATSNPAIAIVAEVEGSTVRVLERKEVAFPTDVSWESLLAGDSSAVDAIIAANYSTTDTAAVSVKFTNAFLIVPPIEYHSLLLSLPFKNNKQINRIIESEIQDILPFDTDDFLLEHHMLGEKTENGYKVHVGALPRRVVKNSLALWHARGVDPLVVCTPATVLQSVISTSITELKPTLYCLVGERHTYLAFASAGSILIDRAIDRSMPYTNGAHGGSSSTESLLFRIKLELGAAERKLAIVIAEARFLGTPIDCVAAEAVLGIPVHTVEDKQNNALANEREQLAMLGALLADDTRSSKVLTNFRVGEFAFRPPLKELLAALRILTPYILLALVLAGLFLIVEYAVEGHEISARRDAIAAEVHSVAPDLTYAPGDDVKALADETSKIESELKDLGSPELFSPLETLAEVSAAFPSSTEVTVDRVTVQGSSIAIEGCASDYTALDNLQNVLSKRQSFVTVKKKSLSTCSSGRAKGLGFRFDIVSKE